MSLHGFIERTRALGIRPKARRKITAQQLYPWTIERQFQQQLQAEFRKAGVFYKEQALKGSSSLKDNAEDLMDAVFVDDDTLRPMAERVAYEVEKFQQACFENFTDTVIGARYIPSVVAPTITQTWEDNFMTLCNSTNDDMKRKISAIISDAVMNGRNIADTAKQIDETVVYFSRSKALSIARTETAKLNMAISKAQMEEAGVEKYEWACMMDERSRASHEKMDGRICIWSNPNVYYNLKTHKTEPRPQSAVHLHPGDDYNCRCVALPWDELIEEELNQKKGKPNEDWIAMKERELSERIKKANARESDAVVGSLLGDAITKFNNMVESFSNSKAGIAMNKPVIELYNWIKEVRQSYTMYKDPVDVGFETDQIMKKLGFSKSTVSEQAFYNINPRLLSTAADYKNNCYNVVITAEMRYRGYELIANHTYTFKDGTCLGDIPLNQEPIMTKAFKNSVSLRFNSLDIIKDKMKDWGDGARAIVGYQRKGPCDGHVILAEQKNGKTIFHEFQSDYPFEYQIQDIDFADPANYFMRVDNLAPTELIRHSFLSP